MIRNELIEFLIISKNVSVVTHSNVSLHFKIKLY